MKKKLLSLLLALLLPAQLFGCAKIDEEDSWEDELPLLMEEEAEEETALSISSFILPYLSSQSLDPVTCPDGVQQVLLSLLYEGLFVLDEHFIPQPLLCESYSYDPEALTYSFTLREGVHFSDGSSLSAQDVVATYRRAMTSERYGARFRDVASLRAVDAQTLTITLTRSNNALPALLDIPIVKAGTETMSVPSGTGPYLFLSSSDGAALSANTAWWQNKPLPLARIELTPAKDNETAAHLFSSYDAHFYLLDQTDSALTLSSGKNDLAEVDTPVMQYLCVNTARAPLDSAALRSAMLRRIDRSELTRVFLSGHARSAQFPISPLSPLYPQSALPALSAADYAALAAQSTAGAQHSMTLLVNAENSFKVAVAEQLCHELSTETLFVECSTLPWPEYLAALAAGNFDLALCEVQLTADWDPTALLSSLGTLNYGKYANEKTDALIAAFLSAHSEESAAELYEHLAAEAPILPLVFKSKSLLTPAGLVDGISPTAANPFYGFENWIFHFEPTE